MKKNLLFSVYLMFSFVAFGNNSGQLENNAESQTSAAQVYVSNNGITTNLNQVGNNAVYEGTVNIAADGSFSIYIDGAAYGFTSYSGNGGVGSVENLYACVPFYNGGVYYVEKSMGQLSATGNPLWVKTGSGGSVYVKVDLTKAVPTYYVKLNKTESPNIILKENFDLFVWGGDWVQAVKGSKGDVDPALSEGTEAGTVSIAAVTKNGTLPFSTSTCATFLDSYRDMIGWNVVESCEFPGYIRVSSSVSTTTGDHKGKLVSPALAKLTSASTATVEFDICRFSSSEPFTFQIEEGTGTITAGEYSDQVKALTSMTITDGSKVSITAQEANEWKGVNSSVKYFTHFKFTINGVTSSTKLAWDATTVSTGAEGRFCIDNILVTSAQTSDVKNEQARTLNIYPSSVNDCFQVRGFDGTAILKLVDMNGREVSSKTILANEPVFVGSLPQGLYMVQVKTSTEGIKVGKIVKL